MESELKRLVIVLNEELKSAQEFLKFSQETNSSLEKLKFSDLRTSVENSPEIISKLLDLEDERTQILLRLSQELGVPCEKLTISELVRVIRESPLQYFGEELAVLKLKLSPVLKELVKVSRINKYLVSRSLSFIEDRIRVFRSATSSIETYGDRGKIKEAGLNKLLIDTQI